MILHHFHPTPGREPDEHRPHRFRRSSATRRAISSRGTSGGAVWSPDGSKILFGNKDFSLFWLDVATKALTKFASSNQMKNDEFFWEVSDYSWSPDGKWVAYSFVEFNRNNKVFLYSLDENRSIAVTDGFYDSMNPTFDANGEYLYFLSYRDFTARMDIFEDNHVILHPVQVMAVQLKAGQAPAAIASRRASPTALQAKKGNQLSSDTFPSCQQASRNGGTWVRTMTCWNSPASRWVSSTPESAGPGQEISSGTR